MACFSIMKSDLFVKVIELMEVIQHLFNTKIDLLEQRVEFRVTTINNSLQNVSCELVRYRNMKTLINKILTSPLLIFVCIFATSNVQAATVEVEWQDPDSYLDIRHGNSHKTKFRNNLFAQLEQHLIKLTTELPQELTLKIKVTNLNLAGDVRYNFSMSQDIRIVQHMYWPSIEFKYSLLNNEQVVKSETVKLKDMAFMDRGGSFRLSHDSYYYEKRMLTEWFDNDLQAIITD